MHMRHQRTLLYMPTAVLLSQGSPEVQGSKFVIGAIIPGSNNQATKEDVFVVVYTYFKSLRT